MSMSILDLDTDLGQAIDSVIAVNEDEDFKNIDFLNKSIRIFAKKFNVCETTLKKEVLKFQEENYNDVEDNDEEEIEILLELKKIQNEIQIPE